MLVDVVLLVEHEPFVLLLLPDVHHISTKENFLSLDLFQLHLRLNDDPVTSSAVLLVVAVEAVRSGEVIPALEEIGERLLSESRCSVLLDNDPLRMHEAHRSLRIGHLSGTVESGKVRSQRLLELSRVFTDSE